MKVAVSGASGLVGKAVSQRLSGGGHDVYALVRHQAKAPHEISWDPESGKVDEAKLAQMDAVIHLAGENIANKRWSAQQKEKIRRSRVDATSKLASAIAASKNPKVLVSASAIGYYGNRGDEILTEGSQKGAGFLADLCGDWEAATRPASDAGVRVANARISMVLSKDGGALTKLLPIFQMGAGGPIGSGKQYMSWIDLDDLADALVFLVTANISGPVNLASPNPVTNAEFTKALGHAVKRPAFLPVPPFALQMMMGELADELLLASQRVMPNVLEAHGYSFAHKDLDSALSHVLSKNDKLSYAANS
jgi:uncharacterized protein (TIGR01777 family)